LVRGENLDDIAKEAKIPPYVKMLTPGGDSRKFSVYGSANDMFTGVFCIGTAKAATGSDAHWLHVLAASTGMLYGKRRSDDCLGGVIDRQDNYFDSSTGK